MSLVFSDAETDGLDKNVIQIGVFFRLDTDPVVALWLGVGDIKPGVNAVDVSGITYRGYGAIGSVPAFRQLINGAAERVEFVLSGVKGEMLAIASGGDAEQVKGKRCSIGIAIMDADWQMLGSVKWMRHFTADFLSIHQQPTEDPKQPIVRSITLSCGSLMTGRRRPSLSYFTDQDQQSLYPGDKFCERTPRYANNFQKTWPRY